MPRIRLYRMGWIIFKKQRNDYDLFICKQYMWYSINAWNIQKKYSYIFEFKHEYTIPVQMVFQMHNIKNPISQNEANHADLKAKVQSLPISNPLARFEKYKKKTFVSNNKTPIQTNNGFKIYKTYNTFDKTCNRFCNYQMPKHQIVWRNVRPTDKKKNYRQK